MSYFFSSLTVVEYILLGATLVFFCIELFYWLMVLGRVAIQNLTLQARTDKQPPVSIILSARNEYQMLQENLPLILAQDYPEFEVVVVNDCSEDDSEILLASMQGMHPNLTFRTIVKDDIFRHGKKMPLGVGIKAAKYDLFLFIDADCRPSGNQWLQNMQRYFTPGKDIVIGYTRLDKSPKWIRADRFMQALNFLGKALTGRAYMASNSNLAYRKQLFFDNKGFDVRVTEHLREDVVFVNKTATRENTAVALNAEATTVSSLCYSADEWRRYRLYELDSLALAGRGSRYPGLREAICRVLFFTTLTASTVIFFDKYPVLIMLGTMLAIRFAGVTVVFFRSQKRLGERGLLPVLWLWDMVSPLFYIYLLILANFKRKKTWR